MEVPQGRGTTGFMNAPLTTSEVRGLKKELKPLLDDPERVAEQIDQFLGSKLYTWTELMSILGILFSKEERNMICRAAMGAWERDYPASQNIPAADVTFPARDPQWNNNNAAHQKNMRDLQELIIKAQTMEWPLEYSLKNMETTGNQLPFCPVLDPVASGCPQCIQSVAANAILVEESRKITFGGYLTVF
nr:uncharacterized protein LOC129533044 [Gorilla gorilla gorilla]